MALFDRNNDRGWRGMGDEHLRRDYENRSGMDAGGDYRGGRGREGLWANSWSDGAWTADAADRTDRDWNLGGGGRYDRDVRPTEAGWRAGGMSMNRGGMGMSGGMSGGMGMNRGGMDRDRGWNLAGGEWGHNWGSGNLGGGYGAGGMDRDRDFDRGGMSRGGGFMDRAQNAVRRGWEHVEDTFDRDNDRMHMGGGSMRGGTSWAGNYDRDMGMRGDSGVRGYRDDEGHYGVTRAPTDMNRGMMSGGMNRYGMDYDRGMQRGTWQGRGMPGRYDQNFRGGGRSWF